MSVQVSAERLLQQIAKSLFDSDQSVSVSSNKKLLKEIFEATVCSITDDDLELKHHLEENSRFYRKQLLRFLNTDLDFKKLNRDVKFSGKSFSFNFFSDAMKIKKHRMPDCPDQQIDIYSAYLSEMISNASMSTSRLGEILKQCRNSEEERTNRPNWLIDVEKLCSVASGSSEPIALQKTMLYFQSRVTDDVLERITSLDVLKSEITEFLLWCHMKLSHVQELSLLKPCLEDLLAAIVSVYVNVVVLASRSSSTEERLVEGKHLCSTVVFLFSKKPEYVLDVLIQTNAIESTDEELVGPLCRKCLLYPYKMNCDTYIKYVAVTRRCRKLWPNSSINAIETAVLSTPEGFLDWIKEKNGMLHSKFPISKHFKKKKILKFLLEEATEDFIDELLNIITDEMEEDEVNVKETNVHEENMDFSFVIENRPDLNVANTFSNTLSRDVEKKDMDILDIAENLFGDVVENVEEHVESHSHEMMEIEEIEEDKTEKRLVDTKKSPTKIEKQTMDSSFVSGTESAEDLMKKKKKRKNKGENDDNEVKNLESDFDKEIEQSFEVKLGEELQPSSKKKKEKYQRKIDTNVELPHFSELERGNKMVECSKEKNCLSMTGDELVTGDEECSGDLKGSKKKKRKENTKLVNNESQSIVKDETPQKSLCSPSIDGEHEEMKDCGSLTVQLQDVSTDSSKKKTKRHRRKSKVDGEDAISSTIVETQENQMKNNEESVINVKNTDLVSDCDSSILHESPKKRKSKRLEKSVDLADGAIDHMIISSTDMSDTGSENVNSAGKKSRKKRNSETVSSCHEIEIVQDDMHERIKDKKVNVSDDVISTPSKLLDEIIDSKNSKSSSMVKRERKITRPEEATTGNEAEIVVIDSDSTQDEVERSDENMSGKNVEEKNDCGSSKQCKSPEKTKTITDTIEVSSHPGVDSELSISTPSKTKAADAIVEKPNSASKELNKLKNKSRKKVVEESATMLMEEFTEFDEVQDMDQENDEAVITTILHNSEKKKKETSLTKGNSSILDAVPVIGLGVDKNILDSGSEKKHRKKRNSENAESCRMADEKCNEVTAVENILAGDDNVNESMHHDVDKMVNESDVISPSPNKQKVESKLFCSEEASPSFNVSKKAECSKQFTALKSPSTLSSVPDDQSIESASKTKSRRKSGAKLIALSLGSYFKKEYGSGQGRPKIYKSDHDKPTKYGSGQRRPRIYKSGQEEPTKCASCQEMSRKCRSDQEISAHIKSDSSEISDYKVVVKQENSFVPELYQNIPETSPPSVVSTELHKNISETSSSSSVVPTELYKNISETSPSSVVPTELHKNISETSPSSVVPTELHKNISETSPSSVVPTELHKNISETSPSSVVPTELHKNISETSPSSVVPTKLHQNIYETSPSSVVPEKKSSNVRLHCCGRLELTSIRDKLPLSNRIEFSNVSLIKCCKTEPTIYKMSPAIHVDKLSHCGQTLKSESSYYRCSSLFSTRVPVSPSKEHENENICEIESSSTESDKFTLVPDISRFLKCDKENQKSSSKVSKKTDTKTKADNLYSFENLDLDLSNQAGKSGSRPDHVTLSRTRSETFSSERLPTKTFLSSDDSGLLPSLISPPSALHVPQKLKKQNLNGDGLDDVLSVISVQTPTKFVGTPTKETRSPVKVTATVSAQAQAFSSSFFFSSFSSSSFSSVTATVSAQAGETPTKLRASSSKVVSSAAKSSCSTLLSSADKSDDSSATERRRSTRIMEKAKNENHHSSQCCPDTLPLSTGKKRKLSFFTESAKKRYELRMHSSVENPSKVTAEEHSMDDEIDILIVL